MSSSRRTAKGGKLTIQRSRDRDARMSGVAKKEKKHQTPPPAAAVLPIRESPFGRAQHHSSNSNFFATSPAAAPSFVNLLDSSPFIVRRDVSAATPIGVNVNKAAGTRGAPILLFSCSPTVSPTVTTPQGQEDDDIIDSHQLQVEAIMKNKLSKNESSRNSSSYSSDVLKLMYVNIIANRKGVLDICGLGDKFLGKQFFYHQANQLIPLRPIQKVSKKVTSSIIVDFYFLYKNMEEHNNMRKLNIRRWKMTEMIGMCERLEINSIAELQAESEKRKIMKSLKVTEEERARKYLEDGGLRPQDQHSKCPKCNHPFVDLPPGNKIIERKNADNFRDYTKMCRQLKDFKEGRIGEPPVDAKGKVLKKIPPPVTEDLRLRCHCLQFQASKDRSKSNCPINCTNPTTGQKYRFGQCYICNCSCSFTCKLGDYVSIQAQVELDRKEGGSIKQKKSKQEEAKAYLNAGIGASVFAVKEAKQHLQDQAKQGLLQCSSEELEKVLEESARYSQASYYVNNPPMFEARAAFESQFKALEDENGKTYIDGPNGPKNLRGNPAKDRMRNNGLEDANSIEVEFVEDNKKPAANPTPTVAESKVQRMKKRAGMDLYPHIPPSKLTPRRNQKKRASLQAVVEYQKAIRNGTCEEVLDTVEISGISNDVFLSQEYNDAYINITS